MKVILLGNGFDLHHNLPTNYIDILSLFAYWTEHISDTYETIGELLEAYSKTKYAQSNIINHYNNHKSALDSEKINQEEARTVLKQLQSCFWFSYFLKSKYEDIDWIDFETEIQNIIKIFGRIISNQQQPGTIVKHPDCPAIKILHMKGWDTIHIEYIEEDSFDEDTVCITVMIGDKFIYKNPYKPYNNYIADDIANYLYIQLDAIKYMMCFYLKYIVNIVVSPQLKSQAFPAINHANYIINLNYTTTVEKIYELNLINDDICHYHGKAKENEIVLGVNASIEDEMSDEHRPDTTFIMFKKYYQRIINNFDYQYLKIIKNLEHYKKHNNTDDNPIELIVIGHSLDISDEDIIKDLFNISDRIQIYYYDALAHSKYIKNLTKIFGKSTFLEMRRSKKLYFTSIN